MMHLYTVGSRNSRIMITSGVIRVDATRFLCETLPLFIIWDIRISMSRPIRGLGVRVTAIGTNYHRCIARSRCPPPTSPSSKAFRISSSGTIVRKGLYSSSYQYHVIQRMNYRCQEGPGRKGPIPDVNHVWEKIGKQGVETRVFSLSQPSPSFLTTFF